MKIEQLVEEFKNGNINSFDELISSVQEQLYRIIYSYVKNKDDSLDILSETIYKAYINLNKLNHPEFFNTWIIRIAINECKNYFKKQKKTISFEECHYEKSDDNEKDDILYDIKRIIDSLPENIKTTLILKYYSEQTFEAIAKILNQPVSTIKTWNYKGIDLIRQELEKGGCI